MELTACFSRAISAKGLKSPMGESIVAYLRNQPRGAISAQIIAELMKEDEYKQRINKNKSTPYNVIKQLVLRGAVTRGDDGVYRIAS